MHVFSMSLDCVTYNFKKHVLTNFNIQRLPDQDLCGIIKDILQENENSIREYEIRKDYNGLIQSKKLFIYEN